MVASGGRRHWPIIGDVRHGRNVQVHCRLFSHAVVFNVRNASRRDGIEEPLEVDDRYLPFKSFCKFWPFAAGADQMSILSSELVGQLSTCVERESVHLAFHEGIHTHGFDQPNCRGLLRS